MEEYENSRTSNGRILMLLLLLTVASQFDGASFESIAKTAMYGMWGAVFIIYSFSLKYIVRTRYVLTGTVAAVLLVLQYLLASVMLPNYNPPIIMPFITSLLFYIVGMLFFRMGLSTHDLQVAFRAYCIACILLGMYIWFTFYGDLGHWFDTDVNLYGKKNSAGQILAVGVIISFFYLKSKTWASKLINIIIGLSLTFIIMIIHCRTALLALCAVIFVNLFLLSSRKQKMVIIAVLPFVFLLVFNMPFLKELVNQALYINKFTAYGEFTINAFLSNRLDWFTAAYEKFTQSATTVWLGIGRSYVDNLFINVLTSSGIIGALIIASVYLNRFTTNLRFTKIHNEYILLKTLSIFYIVESFAEGLPPYGPGACSVIFWLLCGYCDVLHREDIQN